MHRYRVYSPTYPQFPTDPNVAGSTSWEVRQAYAIKHRIHVTDVIAVRLDIPDSWKPYIH